jgi:hypothetical protein
VYNSNKYLWAEGTDEFIESEFNKGEIFTKRGEDRTQLMTFESLDPAKI